MSERLDEKLARIRAGDFGPRDFIIVGRTTPRPVSDAEGSPTEGFRPLADYRADMKRVIDSDLVGIMLTSLSTAEVLTREAAYASSSVTPAVRLNDASDIWFARGSSYGHQPAAPFRTARLDRVH